jgi:pyruvate formate lyase activating enzyme
MIIRKFYKKHKNNIQCLLCPHECIISAGKTGLCGTRKNDDGKFVSLIYGKPCAIHLDPVEKKPLYHFYPGEKILSLGTLGCNLFCRGCQNYDITRARITDLDFVRPEEIIERCINSGSRMIAYTYNEPTIFYEYMIDIVKLAKKSKIKNVIVSNGFINPKPLKELLKYVDAANIDLKGFSETFYKEYANASLKPVLNTIKTIHKSKTWLEITNLLIPGLNDSTSEISLMCDWIVKNIGKDVPLHFSRFFPYYKADNINITPTDKLIEAKNIAKSKGIKYVYIGNIGLNENTNCPKCDSLLIKRGFDIKIIGIKNNKCAKCRNIIKGIYN